VAVVFPVLAFVVVLLGVQRSVGWGLLAVLAVGYFSGVVRANFLSVFTTFMFDSAVLGLYVGFLQKHGHEAVRFARTTAGRFVLFLIAWPTVLAFLPVNNFLVQLVALRATVWFLPVLLIATRLTSRDLSVLARGLAVLNLVALMGGMYVYIYGVAALYPSNAVTAIIYASKDVADFEYYRVPSIFLSAHAYGGTMLLTLPFLIDRLAGAEVRFPDRVLAAAGIVAAVGGILLCAARSPLVIFAVTISITWVLCRFSPTIGLIGLLLLGGGVGVALKNERLQRVASLEDTEYVETRIQGSANADFFELLMTYPAGAGIGSSVGTSIPYFLADVAPEPIGLENEYSRILVDQGWIGLGGWLAFVGWLFARPPVGRLGGNWRLGLVLMYSLALTSWLTAFIGAGLLSSIPGSVLLLTQMGVVAAQRSRSARPAVRPVPRPTPRP
jgi:hypothetical protein